jgi:hypothetical protein
MSEKRPSNRELFKKLEASRQSLKRSKGFLANPEKAIGELFELNILESDQWDIIGELLEEIKNVDLKNEETVK